MEASEFPRVVDFFYQSRAVRDHCGVSYRSADADTHPSREAPTTSTRRRPCRIRALGPPEVGRRDQLSDLGRRRLASPTRFHWPARRQAGPRSPTRAPGLLPCNGSGRYAAFTNCTLELSTGRLFLVTNAQPFSCGVPRPIRRLALAGDPEGGTSRPRRHCCHAA